MVHIYTMEYYSMIKKNEVMPFAAAYWCAKRLKTNIIWYHLYVESKTRKGTNELT